MMIDCPPPPDYRQSVTASEDVTYVAYAQARCEDFRVPASHQRLGRAQLRMLARLVPDVMLKILPQLEPAELTFAAEIAGEIEGHPEVVPALLSLLAHESALVREGAVYGLAHHLSQHVRARLADLSADDPSPAVRAAAAEIVAES
ncbi:MAG: HEAT repeat domain-containing protein [Planctomycetota bacterium]